MEIKEIEIDLSGGVSMKFMLIPPGEFVMGGDDDDYEKPPHKVRITKPFYMGTTEVTQAQYKAFLKDSGYNSAGSGRGRYLDWSGLAANDQPAVYVSWKNVETFCEWLTKKSGAAVSLPTEAQWEYACRAGTRTRYSFGDSENELDDYAWYKNKSGSKTHPVGQKRPNAWGLYDMHGNVLEWCQDWYEENYYAKSPKVDPTGPQEGFYRVIRGGCWLYPASFCRSAARLKYAPLFRCGSIGFRVCVCVYCEGVKDGNQRD